MWCGKIGHGRGVGAYGLIFLPNTVLVLTSRLAPTQAAIIIPELITFCCYGSQ